MEIFQAHGFMALSLEYAPDANAHLTIPVQVNASLGTSGAWMVQYWTDFDLEAVHGINSKFRFPATTYHGIECRPSVEFLGPMA